jgi:hypothetical protein
MGLRGLNGGWSKGCASRNDLRLLVADIEV